MTKQTSPSFEASMAELENIVAQLESGELSLEASLKLFERGIELTRLSQATLEHAEQKVKILLDRQGQQSLQDFIPEPSQGE